MKNYSPYLIYPFFCLIPIAIMVTYVTRDPAHWYVATFLYLITIFVVALLQRLFPWEPDWNSDLGDSGLDFKHLIANLSVSAVALIAYSFLFHLVGHFPFQLLMKAPVLLQYFIGLVIFDLGLYWVHRLSHVRKWLWRLHAIHHSSERIYSVNGQKRHVLHEILEGLPGLTTLFILGINPEVTLAIIYTVNIHLLLQHANVSYRAGWLVYIFSVAESHRWHHQREWRDVQGNYGAVFSFWDLLFGSVLKQTGSPSSQVGLSDPPDLAQMSYVKQHVWPFTSN